MSDQTRLPIHPDTGSAPNPAQTGNVPRRTPTVLDSIFIFFMSACLLLFIIWLAGYLTNRTPMNLPSWLTDSASNIWTKLIFGTGAGGSLLLRKWLNKRPSPNFLVWIPGIVAVLLFLLLVTTHMFPAETALKFVGTGVNGTANFADDGGEGSCAYVVSMTGTQVYLTVDKSNGSITSGKITSLMTENAQHCPHQPIPTNLHEYLFNQGEINGDSIDALFSAAVSNQPQGSATLLGKISKNMITGVVTFQRTGPFNNLNWTVRVPVSVRATK